MKKKILELTFCLLFCFSASAQISRAYSLSVDSLVWKQIYSQSSSYLPEQVKNLHKKYQDIDKLRLEYALIHNVNMKNLVSNLIDNILTTIKSSDDLKTLQELYDKQKSETEIIGSLEFQKSYRHRINVNLLDAIEKYKKTQKLQFTKYKIWDKEFEDAFNDYWGYANKELYESVFQSIEKIIMQQANESTRKLINNFIQSFQDACINYFCITLMEFCSIEDLRKWKESYLFSPVRDLTNIIKVMQDYMQTITNDPQKYYADILYTAKNARPNELIDYVIKTRSNVKPVVNKISTVSTIPWNKGIYTGEIFNTLPHGKGIYTDKKGTTYEGNWKEGLRHGYIIQNKKGKIKENLWADDKILKEKNVDGDGFMGNQYKGKPFGQGTLYKKDGTVETGVFIDGKLHGNGSVKIEEDFIYEGVFDYGRFIEGTFNFKMDDKVHMLSEGKIDMTGTGIGQVSATTKQNKIRTRGLFNNFIPDGLCEKVLVANKDSVIYSGTIAHGDLIGEGKMKSYFSNGYMEYEGKFYDNQPYEGKIIRHEENDSVTYHYEGEYNGKYHGKGKILMTENQNSIIYDGDFKDGVFSGYGKYSSSTFSYVGTWLNGQIHGIGIASNSEGMRYEGGWQMGIPQGKGKLIMRNKFVVEGYMHNGQMRGVYKNPEGEIIDKDYIAGFSYYYKYLKRE